jgi:hypothetical protein
MNGAEEFCMNQALSDAAANLVARAETEGQRGRLADAESLERLSRDAGERIPEWYVDLLLKYPFCGLELGWQFEEAEVDDIAWMMWSDANGIRSESLKCYPGMAILEKGWINVASDPMGGGDPYFIPTDKGDDPPVFQVYHDVSDDAEVIIARATRLVSPSLSQLFLKAKLVDG